MWIKTHRYLVCMKGLTGLCLEGQFGENYTSWAIIGEELLKTLGLGSTTRNDVVGGVRKIASDIE